MINRRLPSTIDTHSTETRTLMFARVWLSAVLTVRHQHYLLVRHDEDIPGIHRTKWKLPYCRYLPHEDPRITISAYLKALTGMSVDVAMLAVPVGRKNETTLYFHANLDSPPPVLNLPPYYDHAWLSPEQLNVSPYFADGIDIEALASAKPPWPGTEAT
jgi:hypothetical protein